jgi:hypothetical protein
VISNCAVNSNSKAITIIIIRVVKSLCYYIRRPWKCETACGTEGSQKLNWVKIEDILIQIRKATSEEKKRF